MMGNLSAGLSPANMERGLTLGPLRWLLGGEEAAMTARPAPGRRSQGSGSRSRTAVPGSHSGRDEWLTVDEVCSELKIGRRTFERWRSLGTAPRAVRLAGNGPLRIRRSWLDEWAEDGAA